MTIFFSDLSSLSSSSDDLSTSLSSDDEGNNNPTPSTESFSSPDAEEEEEELTDNLSTIDESTEVIYSDPLDALEKATDTRIYNCPEFDENEEVIYEEAGPKIDIITTKSSPKQSPKSPKRRKRATMSTATGNEIVFLKKSDFEKKSIF